MSDSEEGNGRHVCSIFESQTWRKSLCKNCFHSLQEHSEQLLAQEGLAVAKEKAAAKLPSKTPPDSATTKTNFSIQKTVPSTEGKSSKTTDGVKDTRTAKEKSPNNGKEKLGVNKNSIKNEDKLVAKDAGHENDKPLKPTTITSLKSPKGKLLASASSVLTFSTSSLPTISSKPSPKPSSPSPATSPDVTINSPTTTISDKNTTSDAQKPLASKTKNFASKFESKNSILSKDKPVTPPDIRPGNSVSLNSNSKPADPSPDIKPSSKSQLEKTDEPKPLSNKVDPKSPRKTTEGSTLANGIAKPTKSSVAKTVETKATRDEKSRIENQKDNKPAISTKNESHDLKLATSRSKPATPKDTLNGSKKITKLFKSSPEPDDTAQPLKVKDESTTKSMESLKAVSPKSPTPPVVAKDSASPNSKSHVGKVNDIKGKQPEEESNTKAFTKSKSPEGNSNSLKIGANTARLGQSSENLESTKPGLLTKSSLKTSDSKSADNSVDSTKALKARTSTPKECSPVPDTIKNDSDKSAISKDREKQKADGNVIEKKNDTTVSPSSNGTGCKLASSTSPTSKNTSLTSSLPASKLSPLNPLSKTAESKSQRNLTKLDTNKDSKPAPNSLEKFKSLENKSNTINDKQTLQSPIKSSQSFTSSQATKTKENVSDKVKYEPKSTTKTESKEKPKEELKVVGKADSKIKTKFDPKDKVKVEVISKTKDEMKGRTNIETQNKTKVETKETNRVELTDKQKLAQKDVAKVEPNDKTKDKLEGKTKVEPQYKTKVEPLNKTKVESQNKTKVESQNKTKVDTQNKTKVEPQNKTKVEHGDKTKVEPLDKTESETKGEPEQHDPKKLATPDNNDTTKLQVELKGVEEKLEKPATPDSNDTAKLQAELKGKEEKLEKPATPDSNDTAKLHAELKGKEEKLSALSEHLSKMEEQMRALQDERDHLKGATIQSQRKDTEQMLNDLRTHLSSMESQCCRLERDNQTLIDKFRVQEASVKLDQECRGKNSENVDLEEDLEVAEKELEDVKGVNTDLQRQIMDMKQEMEEMYDHFRESEQDEFRELQKELDITAKNCRILQFKLRKAERLNDQIEEDRIHYEEKLRMLQDQFDSKDAKNHIRVLEEELRVAKEVSVRLHDELDIVEDKRNKALDDNRHLTDLLEHTDRRQFRLQVEIDKLRDIVADLKYQLKEARSENKNNNNNKESAPDRKVHCNIYTRSSD